MVIFPESDHLVAILALLPSAAYSSSLGFRFLNGKMGLIIRPPQRLSRQLHGLQSESPEKCAWQVAEELASQLTPTLLEVPRALPIVATPGPGPSPARPHPLPSPPPLPADGPH